MKKSVILIFFIITSLSWNLFADDISIRVNAPSQLVAGDRFRLEISVNARPSEFIPPTLSNFKVISGPNQSSSSSVQIINGKVTQSESFTYAYILEALQQGSYTIGSAIFIHNKVEYRSDPLTINVVRGGTTSASPQQQPSQQQSSGSIKSDDIFIRATVSNQNPFQGEQIVISYKIYTRVNIAQYSIEKTPGFQAFWTEDVNLGGNQQAYNESINGVTYRVAEIRRVIAFPQRSGEMTIDPLELECIVQIPVQGRRGSVFDDFFGGSFFGQVQNERVTVRSNPIKIDAKPLPNQNRPATFSGLVGSFDISASVNNLEIKANDASNLVITVSGKGNIRMVEKLSIQFPKNLEAFDPNVSDNIQINSNGVSGSRKFDYLLIPRTGGEFVIPSIQFTYFDPSTSKYITKKTQSFNIKAEAGQYVAGTSATPSSEDVGLLAEDIRFIYTKPIFLSTKGKYFYKSNFFYVLIILPFALFIIALIFWRRHIELQSNKALVKNRKARRIANKRLKTALLHLNNNNDKSFYEEVSKALWGYISDKMNLSISQLNRDNIEKSFNDKEVPTDLINQFLSALDDCEFARFAPGDPRSLMEDIYKQAESTIINIEKDFRNKI
ncbi:MAG: protein BatD [Bacteroidetes bacterium]|nr:protein BatD [Bacteroidota bacterium]